MYVRLVACLVSVALLSQYAVNSAGGESARTSEAVVPGADPPAPATEVPVLRPVRTLVEVRQGSLLGAPPKSTLVTVTRGLGLNNPTGIFVTRTGNIWIADSSNHRLVKLTSSGNFVTSCGTYGSRPGQFGANGPISVAVDAAYNLYATDPGNTRLQELNYKCLPGQQAYMRRGEGRPLDGPVYVDVDNFYNVYFTTQQIESSPSVWRMRSNWKVFDGFGNTSTWFDVWGVTWTTLRGYTYDMYVTNPYFSWIRRLSPGGKLLRQFGQSGSGAVHHPRGESFAPNGYLYVADSGDNRISWFNASGAYVDSFGRRGSGYGQYNFPADVAVDGSGNLYIADQSDNRIVKTSSKGTVLAVWH